ncbi:glucosamine kinase GspK [Peptococcaceae bacterium CEB3]|nr:glucosamine kinase GspK [Peptococcaceae bacterium CEB3]
MALYIGVDGGGSKTEVMIFDDESRQMALSSGPASNPNTVGTENSVAAVTSLINQGLGKLNSTAERIRGLSLCMAGVDRPSQAQILHGLFQEKYPETSVEVTNDAFAALSAGTHGESGIVLIAGTGSIAVGEGRRGDTARAGGYGNLVGDEGSGFDIGRQGLMAAVQYVEGRGEKTDLWHLASESFELRHPSDLIPRVYDSVHPVGTVASFARYVLEAARYDEVAKGVVRNGAENLARMVESVRHQLHDDVSNRVVLSGSLLTQSEMLYDRLRLSLQSVFPLAKAERLAERPSAGAVQRARRLVNPTLSPEFISASPAC